MEDKPKRQVTIIKSLIIDAEGRILFVRRSREWHKESHGKWEFAGGKIEFGEDPERTAVREAKEETGYDVEIVKLIPKVLTGTWDYGDRLSQQILLCYVCKVVSGNPNTDDKGVSELKWCYLDNVPKIDECLSGTIEFLDEYVESL